MLEMFNIHRRATQGESLRLSRPHRFPTSTLTLAFILIAIVAGALIPLYVESLDGRAAHLSILPVAIFLTILLCYSRESLLLLIVFSRASTDDLFDASRFGIGGVQVGIGGLVNGFAILIAFAILVGRLAEVEPRKQFNDSVTRVWGPFIVVVSLGTLLAPDRSTSIRLYLQLLSHLAVFIGAYFFVQSPKQFRSCIWIVLASSVIPVVYGCVQLAMGGNEYANEGLRIRSTFGHPNIFAAYLTLVISLTFYILKCPAFELGSTRRAYLCGFLLLLLALLMLTKSRFAWFACFAFFFSYACFFERRYFVYLALVGIAGLLVPGVADRFLDLTQNNGNEISSREGLNSFAWRLSIWGSALSWMTPLHYLYGYGMNAFEFWAPTFFKQAHGVNWAAHNIYMKVFFDLGLIGLASFLWMYGQLLAILKRLIPIDKVGAFTITFLVVEYLVMGTSDNMLDYLTFNWYMWFLFGAGLAFTNLQSRALPVAAESAASIAPLPSAPRPTWQRR